MQTFYTLLLLLAVGATQFVTAEGLWSDLEKKIDDRTKKLGRGAMNDLQEDTKSLEDYATKQLETIQNKDKETKKKIEKCVSQNHTESLLKLSKIHTETINCLQNSKQDAHDQVNTVKAIVGKSNTKDEEGIAATKKIEENFMNATQDCIMAGVTNRRELREEHYTNLSLCTLQI